MDENSKYLDPRWQKLRLSVLERDGWTCKICGDDVNTLYVHHRYYTPKKEIWDYDLDAFVTLCKSCHEEETFERKNAEDDLITSFKRKFLVSGLKEFVVAIVDMPMLHLENVVAAAYGWALQNDKMQREIIEKYFKYLHKKNKVKENV